MYNKAPVKNKRGPNKNKDGRTEPPGCSETTDKVVDDLKKADENLDNNDNTSSKLQPITK